MLFNLIDYQKNTQINTIYKYAIKIAPENSEYSFINSV